MRYETETYLFQTCHVGCTLENKLTGESVYFQPGDDTTAILTNVEALEELPESRRNAITDMLFSEYV